MNREAFDQAIKDARNEAISESEAQDLADVFGPIASGGSETYLVAFQRTRHLDQTMNAAAHEFPLGDDEGMPCVGDFDLEESLTTARCPICGTILERTERQEWNVVGWGTVYEG